MISLFSSYNTVWYFGMIRQRLGGDCVSLSKRAKTDSEEFDTIHLAAEFDSLQLLEETFIKTGNLLHFLSRLLCNGAETFMKRFPREKIDSSRKIWDWRPQVSSFALEAGVPVESEG
ncbi:15477_t:CDS:2, partial [Acaulospora colombiana]